MAHPEELTLSEDIKTEKEQAIALMIRIFHLSRTTNAISDSMSPITLTLQIYKFTVIATIAF